MTETTLRMRILREVALRADGFYSQAERLGRQAAASLTDNKRAQITGLEGIANSAIKATDVYDFVKVRTARQKEWRSWGPDLLQALRSLHTHQKAICETLQIAPGDALGLEVQLLLIREFVRQMAAQYEYACKFPEAAA